MTRVLIGTSVRQQPKILSEYLVSLENIKKDGLICDFCFVDDNIDYLSKQILNDFKRKQRAILLESVPCNTDYVKDDDTHYWKEELIWKVAKNKNMILKYALEHEYDYIFLVDSDLVLHPMTLLHLLSLEKDIVSEVFWTKWSKNSIEMPQVWLSDQYNLFYKQREERLTNEEINKRTQEFINKLIVPGVYKVGGLGGCTLISKNALRKGVSYDEIYNLTFWGEDRHFCVRAVALGFDLFVDTNYPAFHIYRETDLLRLEKYKHYVKDYGNNYIFLPGDRLVKKCQNKITLAMIIRNEADRYLSDVLNSVKDFIDNAVIVDDASTDNSEDVVRNILGNVPLLYHKNNISKFSNEVELRKQLWDLTLTTKPDWILCLDADEIFEERAKKEIRKIIEQPYYDVIGFRLYDFWNENQYREDKYWNAHLRYWPLLIRYQPFFEYKWKETPQHCGRFPYNVTELPATVSDLRVKHMGWAKEEDRLRKYNRYIQLDKDAKYGIKEQYESILDRNLNLVDWEEDEKNRNKNVYKTTTLSLCLITKDEEKNIARCINSVKDIVDEIVVVDTGSKDRTVEIAQSLGAKVIHAKWEDDYSKARNIAIENATSDWILFLDADEEIKKEDVGKIRPLLNDDTVEAYMFKIVNYGGASVSSGLTEIHYNFRLFRNNGKLKYVYPIHENLRNIEENRVPVFKNADVTILHYGYLSETRIEKNKTERYINMLLKYLMKHPNDKFQHGNLGVEYFNARDYKKALKHLLIATKGMNVNSYSAPRLLRYLIQTYTALKDYETALKLINDAKAYYIDIPDFKFLEGMLYVEQKRYKKAIEMFKECIAMGEYKGLFITMGGTGSYRARYMIAYCYEKLGRLHDAVKEYIEILKTNPNYQDVFVGLFDLFVRNEKPESVREFFDKYVDKRNLANFAILAKLYMNIGRFDIAKEYLDEVDMDIAGLNTLKGIACMGMKDYQKAIEFFDKEHKKAKSDALYHKILCHLILKEVEMAKRILWEIEDSADKKLFLTILGEIKASYYEVKDSYFKLLEKLIQFGEFDLFNELLKLYTGVFTRDDYVRYGHMMKDKGFDELAVAAYIKAADLNCEDSSVYRYLAEKALEQNMTDEALVFTARAFNIDRMDVDNYALMYKIYKVTGRNDEAERVSKSIKEIYPEIELEEIVR